MDYNINFPNLHIYLDHVGKSIFIGSFEVAFYGMIIGLGMLAGIAMACHMAKISNQNPDDYIDLAIVAIIISVIGARIYYVAFSWDYYKGDLLKILNTREGGLAIYGGVIGAIISVYGVSIWKKQRYGNLMDTAAAGLVLGQIIGRWGNFCNREAFGGYTNNLLAMQLPVSAVRAHEITAEQMANQVVVDGITYIQVHPTFLYESLWNVGVLILLLVFFKHRRFYGEVFLLYLAAYGAGRFWIEGLRTDQLIMPVTGLPVSQVLAAVMVVVASTWIIIGHTRAKKKGIVLE